MHALSTRTMRHLCDRAPKLIVDRTQLWDDTSFDFIHPHRWHWIQAPNILTKHACLQWQFLFRCNASTDQRFYNADPWDECKWCDVCNQSLVEITSIFCGNVQQQKKFGFGPSTSCSMPLLNLTSYLHSSMQCSVTDCHLLYDMFNSGRIGLGFVFCGSSRNGAMPRFLISDLPFNLKSRWLSSFGKL